jgi:hypothetical protein
MRVRHIAAFLLALSGIAAAGPAATQQLLKSGWEEFSFQNFSASEQKFRAVMETGSDADSRLQARIGVASVTQYQQPGRDPVKAAALYDGILKDLPPGHALRALAWSRLGQCRMEQAPPALDQARAAFREALASDTGRTVVAQETVLHLATTYLMESRRDAFETGLKTLDELLPRVEGGPLESVAHGIAAQFALILDDPRRLCREWEAQLRVGIENRGMKARTLFQVARLCESRLRDYPKAAVYYRRLADEVPTDSRAYFARLRAAELAQGKIVSAYEPPPAAEPGAR